MIIQMIINNIQGCQLLCIIINNPLKILLNNCNHTAYVFMTGGIRPNITKIFIIDHETKRRRTLFEIINSRVLHEIDMKTFYKYLIYIYKNRKFF